jgi:hypothetical protein
MRMVGEVDMGEVGEQQNDLRGLGNSKNQQAALANGHGA